MRHSYKTHRIPKQTIDYCRLCLESFATVKGRVNTELLEHAEKCLAQDKGRIPKIQDTGLQAGQASAQGSCNGSLGTAYTISNEVRSSSYGRKKGLLLPLEPASLGQSVTSRRRKNGKKTRNRSLKK
jgi:hypothetical protein